MGSVLCGMATLIITSRALGPDGRGLVATVTSILLLVPIIASCGLPMSIRRTYATASEDDARQGLGAAKALAFPLGLAVLGASLFGAWQITGALESESLAFALAVATCCATGIWWLTDAGALLGSGRVGAYATVLVLPSLLLAGLVLVVAAVGQLTVTVAIACQVAAYALTAGYSAFKTCTPPNFSISGQRQMLRTSMPYMGGQIAEALSYRLDQAVAIVFLGAAGAGQYSIAATIGMLPSTLGLAVSAATFREVASTPRIDGRTNLTAIRVAVLAALPAALIAAACVPVVIPLVFGAEFQPAVPATLLALLGSMFLVICQGAASALIAQGKGWHLSMALLLGLFVGITGLAILGPRFGVLGAAAASALGFAVSSVIALRSLDATLRGLIPQYSDIGRLVGTFTTGRL